MADYSTNDGTHDFHVNLCGPLVGKEYFDLPSQSAVAMTKGNSPSFFSGGKYPGQLIFNDGVLTMELEGGSECHSGKTYSSQIIFICDHDDPDPATGLSIYRNHAECRFNFVWRTKYACPPHSVIDCSFTTKDGLKYDLNPLSLPNLNQEETDSNNNHHKYVLNVCRSVVHSKSARCPYDAASCLVDTSNKDPALNLGIVDKGPYLENGVLKLKYTGGSTCNASSNYSTEIVFECDPEDNFPYPNLVTKEDCKFIFEWRTAFACPEKVEVAPIFGNCSVKNIYSNYVYDLSSLSKPGGYTLKKEDVTLNFDVCNPMKSCPNVKDGACSSEANGVLKSAGNANANLIFNVGQLTLSYSGGSKCANGIPRTTFISFYCGSEKAMEGPVFVSIDEESCIYFVNWHTNLACDSRVDCFAGSYDLSPLIKHHDNYRVSHPNITGEFRINVCRPLNNMHNVHCDAGSSSCLVNSSSPTAVSLGKPIIRPNLSSQTSVMLLYPLGAQCKDSPGFKYTTRITFECDKMAGLVSVCFLPNLLAK